MGDIKKTVGGIVVSVLLLLIIFFEVKFGFAMLKNRQMAEINEFVQAAQNFGKANVTIDTLTTYEEIPGVDTEGDVVKLDGYKVKLRVNGKLVDGNSTDSGIYMYSSTSDNLSKSVTVKRMEVNVTDMRNAVKRFWYGDTSELTALCASQMAEDNLTFYQSSAKAGDVPVVYSKGNEMYTMFITGEEEEYYLEISCNEPFALTDDKITVHYDDPQSNPQLYHTYSNYESLAAENTMRQLLEDDTETSTSTYNSSQASGSSSTYTSEADDKEREALAKLGNYKFDQDGKSTETEKTIDITSPEAEKSKWTLTATTYTYECKGLKLYALSGSRTAEQFQISGTIQNTLSAERPYVIVVKYLDSANKLLGISVIDQRNKPIKPNDATTFSATITPAKNKIDIQRITAVMFEVY